MRKHFTTQTVLAPLATRAGHAIEQHRPEIVELVRGASDAWLQRLADWLVDVGSRAAAPDQPVLEVLN